MRLLKSISEIIGIVISFFFIISDSYSQKSNLFLGLILIINTFILLIYCRDCFEIWFLELFTLYVNYSVVINDYFPNGTKIPLPYYGDTNLYGLAMSLMVIFQCGISMMINKPLKTNNVPIKIYQLKNKYVSLCLGVVEIIILIFFFDRTVTDSYSVHISPIYEYIYIFIFFSLLYSKRGEFAWYINLIIAMVAIVQDLIYGGRITSLQIIFILILLYQEFIRRKFIIIGMVGGIATFTLFGIYRTTYSFDGYSFGTIMDSFAKNRFALDTAYYAWHTSVTGILTSDKVDMLEKLKNNVGFVCNVFGIHLRDYYPLPILANSLGYTNLGGGYTFAYIYFWYGAIGVFIFGLIFGKTINYVISKSNLWSKMVLYIIVASSPRWIMYTPLSFFRPILLMGILFIFCIIIRRITVNLYLEKNYYKYDNKKIFQIIRKYF